MQIKIHEVLRKNLSSEITVVWFHCDDAQFKGYQHVGTYKNKQLVATVYWYEHRITLEEVQLFINNNDEVQRINGFNPCPLEIE